MGRDGRRMVADEAGEEAGDATAQDLVGHGSANPSPGPNPATAFLVNKVLLEHCQPIQVRIVCGWLSCYNIDQSSERSRGRKYLLSDPLRKSVDLCFPPYESILKQCRLLWV